MTDDERVRATCTPVWGMEGEILTDDFPKDHYHHHGIFWSWPHVRLGNTEYSLWMGVKMRHRFRRWLIRETGPVAAVLGFEDGWFVKDKQVVTERIWVRVFKSAPQSRSFDVSITCIADKEPVTLWGAEGKSYGGMTMRFAPPKKTRLSPFQTAERSTTSKRRSYRGPISLPNLRTPPVRAAQRS